MERGYPSAVTGEQTVPFRHGPQISGVGYVELLHLVRDLKIRYTKVDGEYRFFVSDLESLREI